MRLPFALLLAAVLAGLATPSAAAPRARVVLIRDVSIADAAQAEARPHRDVLIRGDRIVQVEPTGRLRPRGARVIDGRGKFLIPGLWDAHVHIRTISPALLPLFVSNGVTSVRDMGGDIGMLKRWRREIETGHRVGPRLKFCGPMLEAPSKFDSPDHLSVANPEQARSTVAAIAADGVDCIKMRGAADKATYFAMAEAAAKAGLPFVGHPPFNLDPLDAIQVRQQTYEHAFYPWPLDKLEPDAKARIFAGLKANGTLLDPTLVAWGGSRRTDAEREAMFANMDAVKGPALFFSPSLKRSYAEGMGYMKGRGTPGWNRVIDKAAREVGEMYRAGIPVLVGTDDGSPFVDPDHAVYEELSLLVRGAGLTPREALAAATSVPATLFHQERDLGSVALGKLADLVLLDADPLKDIDNVARVDTVILGGIVYDPAARKRLRASVVEALKAEWARP